MATVQIEVEINLAMYFQRRGFSDCDGGQQDIGYKALPIKPQFAATLWEAASFAQKVGSNPNS